MSSVSAMQKGKSSGRRVSFQEPLFVHQRQEQRGSREWQASKPLRRRSHQKQHKTSAIHRLSLLSTTVATSPLVASISVTRHIFDSPQKQASHDHYNPAELEPDWDRVKATASSPRRESFHQGDSFVARRRQRRHPLQNIKNHQAAGASTTKPTFRAQPLFPPYHPPKVSMVGLIDPPIIHRITNTAKPSSKRETENVSDRYVPPQAARSHLNSRPRLHHPVPPQPPIMYRFGKEEASDTPPVTDNINSNHVVQHSSNTAIRKRRTVRFSSPRKRLRYQCNDTPMTLPQEEQHPSAVLSMSIHRTMSDKTSSKDEDMSETG